MAADLVTSSGEWRRWLDEALRVVLGPVAVAGAIGLAATGCGSVATPPGIPIGEGSAQAAGASAPGSTALLTPLGVAKPGFGSGTKPGAPALGVTLTSLGVGTAPHTQSTTPSLPTSLPTSHPQITHPIAHPIAMPGRISSTALSNRPPLRPVIDPPAMAGEPPMVEPQPRPRPQPQPIRPAPTPPRLGGDEASVGFE